MAKEKISELTAAATLDGTELVPVVQDGETVRTTAQDIADLGGGGASYLKYVALLTQTGTEAPTEIILENSLSGAITWTRSDIGVYVGTLEAEFTIEKTFVMCPFAGGGYGYANTVDTVGITSPEGDGVIELTPIEIRVYP